MMDQNGDEKISKMEFNKYIKETVGKDIKHQMEKNKEIIGHLKAWKKALKEVWTIISKGKKKITAEDIEQNMDAVMEVVHKYYH